MLGSNRLWSDKTKPLLLLGDTLGEYGFGRTCWMGPKGEIDLFENGGYFFGVVDITGT